MNYPATVQLETNPIEIRFTQTESNEEGESANFLAQVAIEAFKEPKKN